jgi:NAD+ kinase
MRIAVFGRSVGENRKQVIRQLYTQLHVSNVEVVIFDSFLKSTKVLFPKDFNPTTFNSNQDFSEINCDCLFTVGGDGTLLEAVTLVKDSGIPILGLNTGRLGFLTGFTAEEVELAVNMAIEGTYVIDKRSLIEMQCEGSPFGDFPFALNEITFHKKESSTMITVHVNMNGQKLNSYWADGLIISTPTGSTGYSLSCGGPILMPESSSFVITPIAPHNLNVRPLIIDNSNELTVETVVRGKNLLISMDSRSISFPASRVVTLRKAKFELHLARKPEQTFLKTLREKLLWGIDKRN